MATSIRSVFALTSRTRVKNNSVCYCRIKELLLRAKNYSLGTKRSVPAFVDYLQIQACGGAGGQGLPKYGGFGGDGGKVIVVASKKATTLRKVLQKYPLQICKAERGENSDKFRLLGDRGADLHLDVPVGVLVHTPDGRKVDLNNDGDACIAAQGGKGGNNTTNFLGLRGERNLIALELKLLADVGLVGFPNAGKSTFLKAISRTKPKIAAYPFTTLTPQIGMMEYTDGRMISVADLPGLIEGASQNYGMGFKFLRHVERTKLLLYILDINPFQLSFKHPERSAFQALLLLIQELDEYGHGMLEKPSFLALNKIDTDTSGHLTVKLVDLVKNLPDSLEEVDAAFHPKNLPKFDDIFQMSAMKRDNTELVKNRIREVMDEYAEKRRAEELETKNALLQMKDDALRVHDEHLKTTFV
ncbi:hypothetical protein BsWGS_00394 [Bradybaena similaris]